MLRWVRTGTVFAGLVLTLLACGEKEPAPKIKWQFTGAAFMNSPAIGNDGTIYAFSEKDTLYAFNPDGTVKWRLGLPDTVFYHPSNIFISPVVAANGTIYIFAADGNLYAINPNGTVSWRFPIKTDFPTICGTPALGADGTIYVYAPESLYALSPAGSLNWTRYVGGGSCITFPVVDGDSTIYIGADHDLIALKTDGTVKWTADMAPLIHTEDRIALGGDGTVYVFGTGLDFQGNLMAFTSDGALRWVCTVLDSNCINVGTPVIGLDGTIYLGSATDTERGGLYAVSPAGQVRWTKQTTNYLQEAYDLTIDSEGTIYTVEGAFDSEGNLKWRYPLGNVVVFAVGAPAIGADGTVYVASGSGLFAFEGNSSGLANSSWPRSRHDNRNTGNALSP
ncbi:PQQ-like beta-propeller repeat protein [candidate division WOR-3 bacterium]|nr:PQQ-like beta-propeller repeat protein [candidate division WOR-3 bacterium]